MKYRTVLLFVLTTSLVLLLAAVSLSNQQTAVTVSFDEDQLKIDHSHGYDLVRLAGGHSVGLPGEPTLPSKQVHIAIPAGHEALSVTVRSLASQELPGSYHILPGQPPRPTDDSPRPAVVEPDDRVYRSPKPYPTALGRLNRQTDLAGQQMAAVTVYPAGRSAPENAKIPRKRVLTAATC